MLALLLTAGAGDGLRRRLAEVANLRARGTPLALEFAAEELQAARWWAAELKAWRRAWLAHSFQPEASVTAGVA